MSVPALSGAENAKLSVEVPKDVYATVSAQGIDVQAQISVYAEHNDLAEVSLIRSAEYNEEAPFNIAELPSVTMHRTVGGETLWELAKRCRSSAELISAANSLEAGEEPTPGTMLIIPKKRA